MACYTYMGTQITKNTTICPQRIIALLKTRNWHKINFYAYTIYDTY